MTQNLNLLRIAERLKKYKPLPGRMNLIYNSKGILIIDDTYNSSPYAVKNALNDLDRIKINGQKYLVLGDMLELGDKEKEYHLEVGQEIAKRKEYSLIGVGDLARFFVQGAEQAGIKKDNGRYCPGVSTVKKIKILYLLSLTDKTCEDPSLVIVTP